MILLKDSFHAELKLLDDEYLQIQTEGHKEIQALENEIDELEKSFQIEISQVLDQSQL